MKRPWFTGKHRYWIVGAAIIVGIAIFFGALEGIKGFIGAWWALCAYLFLWATTEAVKELRRGRRRKQQRLRRAQFRDAMVISAEATTTTSTSTTTLPHSAPLSTTTTLSLTKVQIEKHLIFGLGRIAIEIRFRLWHSSRNENWKKGIPRWP